jgi:hypothetical protein
MMSCNVHGIKGGIFVMVAVAVSILVVEPLIEKALVSISPTTAAKLGVGA